MALSVQQKEDIKNLLKTKIDNKLKKYSRETSALPFLARLIQDSEKIAAYSFIHSLATSLGMSIYEQISIIIASTRSTECQRNYGVGGAISSSQRKVISKIINELREGKRKANINFEIKEVLAVSNYGAKYQKSGGVADFYMKLKKKEYFFEIKTSKPNIDVFEKSKTKLLEWVARRHYPVKIFLVIPYNPYHPDPYNRFSAVGMMEPGKDFLVGNEYWDFIGDKGTYDELLLIFDEIGKLYKSKLQKKFKELAKLKYEDF